MKIESISTLKSNAEKILAELKVSKEPVLLTGHGQPLAYLIDVEEYERLQRQTAILMGLARGEQDIANGKVTSHQHVKLKFSKWLK